MIHFEKTHIDLGTMHNNSSKNVVFPFTGTPEGVTLNASCGCTEPIYDGIAKEVRVTFRPPQMPAGIDRQETTRQITVIETIDGVQHTHPLTFKSIITRH